VFFTSNDFVLNWENPLEMFEMLKGSEALGRTQMHEWWKRFKDGQTSTDDDPRSGRLSVSKTD
jgi:hypothetical protein